MALKGQLSIRNDTQTRFVSNQIARNFASRGFASVSRVQTVLNNLKEVTDINSLKQLDEAKIQQYVDELREKVEAGDLQAKTAQDYISALNTVIDYTNHIQGTELEHISAAQEGLSREIDYRDKSITEETHQNFQNYLQEKLEQTGDSRFERLQLATELQRDFGLRARESFGLTKESIERALESNKLQIGREDWTKNARNRAIGVRTPEQRETLEKVQNFMRENDLKSLAGERNNIGDIKEFKSFAYNQVTEYNKISSDTFNFHAERHAWAQEQYSQMWQEKTGAEIEAPIKYYTNELEKSGWDFEGKLYDAVAEHDIPSFWDYVQDHLPDHDLAELKEIDQAIREEISEELGHSRLDITNVYLGHP